MKYILKRNSSELRFFYLSKKLSYFIDLQTFFHIIEIIDQSK